MNSVYQVNKGVNKPIEFKGLKAQYIAYLAVGAVALLLLFTILYLAGVHMYICLIFIGTSGMTLYYYVSKYSHKYGRDGLMKKMAARQLPSAIRISSRKIFTHLNENICDHR